MWILGIDTSTCIGSIALLNIDNSKREKIVSEFTLDVDTTHSFRLLPAVDIMLKFSEITVKNLDGIVVCIGPGSFTGIRIGISTANGLSNALNIPVAGVSSLEALAHNLFGVKGYICPIINARATEIYTSIYKSEIKEIHEIDCPRTIKTEDLSDYIDQKCKGNSKIFFIGDGASVYYKIIMKQLNKRAVFVPFYISSAKAGILASIGSRRITSEKYIFEKNIITPLYCRNPKFI
ncbi:MAG: tRNA (adenosine(37)-N6)-threonylcarbamoyltransferase complex dimerization subunit type 1 TsaB [Candidatus Firestonebacteria bacterium]|nr:tRNA (adenosine(37)-N6)-threonylcarbamoyltransferase complex dimerization subunit type 1 TsaB [Candidatus Firestonebacteria bacterium]